MLQDLGISMDIHTCNDTVLWSTIDAICNFLKGEICI